jgi:hypothetical protein
MRSRPAVLEPLPGAVGSMVSNTMSSTFARSIGGVV